MSKSSILLKSLQIERCLLSLYCKNQDKHSSHVRITGQRYNKIRDLAIFVGGKCGYVTKSDLVEVIQCILYKLKTGCQWHMLTPIVLRLMGII